MAALQRALEAFIDHVTTIGWSAVALAVVFHVLKIVCRTRSWRNILAASYPEVDVRWRSVFGAYVAGVGVNALLPARGGDVLKLYLVKRRVDGSTYPTLASTLLVETLFDVVVASALLAWALTTGVLPGLDVLPRLPDIDWLWIFERPALALAVGVALGVGAIVFWIWASREIAAFRARVAQGFAVLRPPQRYLARVVPWQALDWAFRLATVYCLLIAFGIPANLHNALLVQVTQGLSTILPLTPAGIGTEQALLAYVFRGVAGAGAVLAFSVGMKIVLIAVNVALGFTAILLMLRTLRWRSRVEAERGDGGAAGPSASSRSTSRR